MVSSTGRPAGTLTVGGASRPARSRKRTGTRTASAPPPEPDRAGREERGAWRAGAGRAAGGVIAAGDGAVAVVASADGFCGADRARVPLAPLAPPPQAVKARLDESTSAAAERLTAGRRGVDKPT
jgi:hypothetical protein